MCQPLQVEKTRIWIDLMKNVFCEDGSCYVNLCKIHGFLLCLNINLSKVARQACVPVKTQCVPTKCQYCNRRVLNNSASASTLLHCNLFHGIRILHPRLRLSFWVSCIFRRQSGRLKWKPWKRSARHCPICLYHSVSM
jgi:hypothetical protein